MSLKQLYWGEFIIIIITIDDEIVWSAHYIELALWSYTVAKRLRPSLLEDEQLSRPSSTNNSRPRESSSDYSEDSLPPAKRTKNYSVITQ